MTKYPRYNNVSEFCLGADIVLLATVAEILSLLLDCSWTMSAQEWCCRFLNCKTCLHKT